MEDANPLAYASGLEAEDSFRHVEISLIAVAKSEVDRHIHGREVRLIGRPFSIGPRYGDWRGQVKQEMLNIMSQLTNAGIRTDVLQPNSPTEVFVAELPNGKQYLFLTAGLLKSRAEGN
jgi:hypothetical protein